MKNIKYGLIALAAVVVGTGSAYAVSAGTEAFTAEAISISAEPISIEEAAKITKTSHGCHKKRCLSGCPKCTFPDKLSQTGHCKKNGRIHNCERGQQRR